MKRIIAAAMILGCLILSVSCGEKQINPAELYSDLYMENTQYSLEEKQQIIDRIADADLPAVDAGNQINMVNWEKVDEFCTQDAGEVSIYVINDDGSYTQYDLSAADGKHHVRMQVCTGGEEPMVTLEEEYDAVYWDYTDKGYLFFAADHPAGDFAPWLETAIRVRPMDKELRTMTQTYLNVMGYEDNNLFIENWDEKDYSVLELYDIYEVLTGNISAVNQKIPAADFETVITGYLDISQQEIRKMTVYNAAEDTYDFSSRTAEAKGSTPDMPYPEVASVTENADGTLTLLVEAVWPKYRDDRAYVHEVTVRPENGGFKYTANKVVEKKMDTKWYVGR